MHEMGGEGKNALHLNIFVERSKKKTNRNKQ